MLFGGGKMISDSNIYLELYVVLMFMQNKEK